MVSRWQPQKTAVYVVQCLGKDQSALEAIRPSDGRVLWRHLATTPGLHPDRGVDVLAESGYVLAQLGGSSFLLFTAGGTPVKYPSGALTCPAGRCAFLANGDRGIAEVGVNARSTPGNEAVEGFALPSRRVGWKDGGELFGQGDTLAEENGIVYGTAGRSKADTGTASVLEPIFLTALQSTTGRSVTLPLPVADTGSELVAARDGLVFVTLSAWRTFAAFRPMSAVSHSSSPAILANVNPITWPDACSLLTPADIGHVLAGGYTAVPVRTLSLAGVAWPKPVGCTFTGPADRDPAVIVKIAWVASSAGQASLLLGSYLSGEQEWGHPGLPVADGYLVPDDTLNQTKDCVLIPVGRMIAEVTVPGNAAAARALAPIIARNLQRP